MTTTKPLRADARRNRDALLAKARTVLDALANGVQDIHILNGKKPHVLIEELFTNRGAGTVCRVRAKEFIHGEVE